MFQIDNATAATTQPASTPAGTPGYFTDGNPATGVAATILPAEWLNSLMLEVCNAITATGVALDKTKFNQLTTAIKALAGNTGVTPPQFDNSTKTASTAWVNQAGVHFPVQNGRVRADSKCDGHQCGQCNANLRATGDVYQQRCRLVYVNERPWDRHISLFVRCERLSKVAEQPDSPMGWCNNHINHGHFYDDTGFAAGLSE
jgi:hypothetical protein